MVKPEKPKQKTRPKSMFVKLGGGDGTDGGGEPTGGSAEDISARALSGENNSTACKWLASVVIDRVTAIVRQARLLL